MGKSRGFNVPPELRAIARAVADADVREFPDLATAPGHERPSLEALRNVTTEINDGVPLTAQEFKLFRAAYAECQQHLHSVTTGMMASGTPVADVLKVASRLDSLCTSRGLSLLTLFPLLREIHTYLLELSNRFARGRGEGQHHQSGVLLDRLVRFLERLLERAEQALRWYESVGTRAGSSAAEQSSPDLASTATTVAGSPTQPMEDGLPTRDPAMTTATGRRVSMAAADKEDAAFRAALRKEPHGAGSKRVSSSYAEGAAGATAQNERLPTSAADSSFFRPQSGLRRLPASVADTVASVKADLAVHFAHLRWYVMVTDHGAVYFDANKFLEEHTLRAAWERYVGRNRPACTTEEFFPFLKLFPVWTHTAVLSVVDFKECGVVSVYSLQRLLRVWGPLQLLEVNLRHDMECGAVDLSQPFAYLASSLASRPDAQLGDYVIGLTDVLGELRVAVLRRARGYRWHLWAAASENRRRFSPPNPLATTTFAQTQPGSGPNEELPQGSVGPKSRTQFSTVSYTLCHDTGAWMVKGLTREEFDSAVEACVSFPEIFQRPRGQLLASLQPQSPHETSLPRLAPLATTSTAPRSPKRPEQVDGNVSALHRACYRNNGRYVHTLLDRGGGMVVNSALVDPLVCDEFCWTPLLCAVNNPHSDPAAVVRLLLDAGADVHYEDDADCTALYYALANGYAETTRLLLEHCPTLQTSPYTVPVLVAIGAHDCHLREYDVRRLVDVIPSAAVLTVVVAYEPCMSMAALASSIVEEKINGRRYAVSGAERRLVADRCAAGAAGADQHTPEQERQLQDIIAYHTRLCLRARLDVEEAVRVLYAREYALSWRMWLDYLDRAGPDEAQRAGRGMAPIYPIGQLPRMPAIHGVGNAAPGALHLPTIVSKRPSYTSALQRPSLTPRMRSAFEKESAERLAAMESIEYII